MGEREGRLWLDEYLALAELIKQSGFEMLPERGYIAIDAPSTSITVTYVDGHSKEVFNSGDPPFSELWVLQRVLDGLLMQVRWEDRRG
jgi:hypothetical protein